MKQEGYYFEMLRSVENECVADVCEIITYTLFGEFVLDTPLTVGYDQGERGTLLKVSVGYGNLIGFIRDDSGCESWNGNIKWGEFNCIFKVFDQIVAKQK